MRHALLAAAAALALALALPASAQQDTETRPGPADIVNAAPQEDWVVIPPEDLLVMTLAPDAEGNAREVVIQLMPPPFSQGWVENIRLLARERWYDGTSVNRVQDNYVVQWGDPNYDNPEAAGKPKPLPEGLKVMGEEEYSQPYLKATAFPAMSFAEDAEFFRTLCVVENPGTPAEEETCFEEEVWPPPTQFARGWAFATNSRDAWPVHCYGMVGVGRNYSPDTGSGAELYTVIGHAPRHLDRNIALIGRVIGGMEHLSSLPRGKGELGFYSAEERDKRTPILSVRIASELPEEERPLYEYLSTESDIFARYAEARANRRDAFFITPAGGADICNIPVPVRAFEYAGGE
ncbi:peptidylprolyl isomerase [Erythrobacter sp. HL-111]|uniref:peptidylprolyl isomerase n=1 Tax=Erythrobacter sp. HL-111 TaxID=1798193 RepID=UPI0006DAD20F|nr:peptidylprolyl isomerase [Erythrobacter sp. HL-111]KPP92209.1 MAG: peptidylprolyl isomerase [Erythrobacteraceae bacterium HL-111]SDS39992.1 peptidylprolyl isomerase [Erythrobacter sp. HL-111]